MSTCNFRLQCASKYYVLSSYVEEINEEGEKEVVCKEWYHLDFDRERVMEVAGKKEYTRYISGSFKERPMDDNICCKDFYFGDERLECYIGFNNGHYEGATIDYDIRCGDYGWLSDCNTADDFIQEIVDGILADKSYYEGWNKGMCAIQRPNLYKKLSGMVSDIIDEAESICNVCCDEKLVRVGIFSNGEAVYERADSLRGKLTGVA